MEEGVFRASLADADPRLAAQWHPTRNGGLRPSAFSPRSRRRVWWLGPCGHEWETSVYNRAQGRGCPYCAGRKVLAGFNDLATKDPELAAQWHPEKNGSLEPSDVVAGSGRKVWWKGSCGHEWEATVSNRARTGCPYCAGRKVLEGFNDLATTHPLLAAQWHPEKNGSLEPSGVAKGSRREVWWRCPACGCEWKACVADRVAGRAGCPSCPARAGEEEGDE